MVFFIWSIFNLRFVQTFPQKFYEDFLQVAIDESIHFSLLCYRLEEMGSYYGAFAAHDALWESASLTSQGNTSSFSMVLAVVVKDRGCLLRFTCSSQIAVPGLRLSTPFMKREAWTYCPKQSDACEKPTIGVQTCCKRYTGVATSNTYV